MSCVQRSIDFACRCGHCKESLDFLILCCQADDRGDWETVYKMIATDAVHLDSLNIGGRTLASHCCIHGATKAVMHLVKWGLDLDRVHLASGTTALQDAITGMHPSVVLKLLQMGAYLDEDILVWAKALNKSCPYTVTEQILLILTSQCKIKRLIRLAEGAFRFRSFKGCINVMLSAMSTAELKSTTHALENLPPIQVWLHGAPEKQPLLQLTQRALLPPIKVWLDEAAEKQPLLQLTPRAPYYAPLYYDIYPSAMHDGIKWLGRLFKHQPAGVVLIIASYIDREWEFLEWRRESRAPCKPLCLEVVIYML